MLIAIAMLLHIFAALNTQYQEWVRIIVTFFYEEWRLIKLAEPFPAPPQYIAFFPIARSKGLAAKYASSRPPTCKALLETKK